MLSDFFLPGLAEDIERVITIKPKVIINEGYMITLDAVGVMTVVDFIDDKPVLVNTIRHVHDIFGDTHLNIVEYINNSGGIHIIDTASTDKHEWTQGDDIIHIASDGDFVLYTNVRGEVTFGYEYTKINLPVPVVATAIVGRSLFFLTVSGVMIYTIPDGNEDFFDEFEGEITPKDLSVKFPNAAKIFGSYMMLMIFNINHEVLYINWAASKESYTTQSDVLDAFASSQGPILELLTNGNVKLLGKDLLSVKNIIAMSAHDNEALIRADGQVLVRYYGSDEGFTSVPRLRLTT